MEHDEAVQSQAAERYVARELSPAEQDAFEEHFFDCRQCAGDVRFELAFAANVRAVSIEERAAAPPVVQPLAAPVVEPVAVPAADGYWEKWPGWLRPAFGFSLAGNFALAAGFGYLLLTGARPAEPRFTHPYFAPGPTHGAGDVNTLPAGEVSYLVRFPAPGAAIPSYSFEILDAAGRRQSSASLPAPATQDDSLYLQVPVRGLPAGLHTLVVRTPAGEMVSWSKFQTAH